MTELPRRTLYRFSTIFLLSFLLLFIASVRADEFPKSGVMIRVLMDEKITRTALSVDEDFKYFAENKVLDVKQGTEITLGPSKDKIEITFKGERIRAAYLSVKGKNQEWVSYRGKKYRGEIRYYNDQKSLYVINLLDLEDYTRGVVPVEIGLKDPKYFQALKCAAVAGRTYAIMKLEQRQKNFDVYADVRDQAYVGFSGETEIDNAAVTETFNEILTYKGQPAKMFYHSTCGGYTENFENAFGNVTFPYLIAVEDRFCEESPFFEWEEEYNAGEIYKSLVNAGLLKIGLSAVTDIEISERHKTGRVSKMTVKLSDGKSVVIDGRRVRDVFKSKKNGEILRSSLFEIETEKNRGVLQGVIFRGRGYGHGVGMCQWGALVQSQNDTDYRDILKFYFPGTEVSKLK